MRAYRYASMFIVSALLLNAWSFARAATFTFYSQPDNSGEILSQQPNAANTWISAPIGNLYLGKDSLSITFTMMDPHASTYYHMPWGGVGIGTYFGGYDLQKYWFTDADRALLSDGQFHTFTVQTGTTTLGVADGETPLYITFFDLSQYHNGTHLKSNPEGTQPYLLIQGEQPPPPDNPQAPEGSVTIYEQMDTSGVMTNTQPKYLNAYVDSANLGNLPLGQGPLYLTFSIKSPRVSRSMPGGICIQKASDTNCSQRLQTYYFTDADRALLTDGAYHTFTVLTGTTTSKYADGTHPVKVGFFTLYQEPYSTKIRSNADATIPYLLIKKPPPGPCAGGDCASSVLFLPGLEASRMYGSNADGSEKNFWEPDGDGDVLALTMAASGESKREDLYARGVIDNAYAPVKGNVYKSFLEQLSAMKANGIMADYGVAPYDWRLQLDEVLARGAELPGGRLYYAGARGATSTPFIIQELRRLAQASRTGKVTIIAHSNGGLLAKALANKLGAEASQLIDQVIFVAVPQVGTPQAVGAYLHGYEQALPVKPLSFLGMTESAARELAQNMPSGYNLLPSANYFTYTDDPVITFSADILLAPWRAAYGAVIHSGEMLRRFMADPMRAVLPTADPLVAPPVVNSALYSRAEAVHEALDAWTPPAGVSVIEIAGWGEDTLATIEYYEGLAGRCTARKADSTCAAMVKSPVLQYRPKTVLDGDGTVLASSALWLPASTVVKKYWVNLQGFDSSSFYNAAINRKHADILEIPQLRTLIQNLITGSSTALLPDYIATSTPTTNILGKQLHFTLHSPLSLDLYDGLGNHTGVSTTTNSVEENIPGSRYRIFGEVQQISVPESANVSLIMKGRAEGSFTLDVAEVEGSETLSMTTFAAVPTSPDTVATLSVPAEGLESASALSVDENGDGAPDILLEPKAGETVTIDLKLTVKDMLALLKQRITDTNPLVVRNRLYALYLQASRYERDIRRAWRTLAEMERLVKSQRGRTLPAASADAILTLIKDLQKRVDKH